MAVAREEHCYAFSHNTGSSVETLKLGHRITSRHFLELSGLVRYNLQYRTGFCFRVVEPSYVLKEEIYKGWITDWERLIQYRIGTVASDTLHHSPFLMNMGPHESSTKASSHQLYEWQRYPTIHTSSSVSPQQDILVIKFYLLLATRDWAIDTVHGNGKLMLLWFIECPTMKIDCEKITLSLF